MKPLIFRSFLLSSFIAISACGPVNGRVFPTAQDQAKALAASKNQSRDLFQYNEAEKICVNSIGSEGYNLDTLGPCGMFYGAKAKFKATNLDLRGSLFISVQFLNGSNFDGAILDDAKFIEAQGKTLSFKKASLKRTEFKHCEFTDPTQKK